MQQMQELNTKKDTATNPMIMFLVLNTSGLTIIPTTILAFRASYGAAQPTDVFIPILMATLVATLAGIIIPLNGSTSDSYGKGYQVKGLKVVIDDSKACPLLHSIKVF